MKEYEPMSAELEMADEELQQETREHDSVIAPSTQHENDIQGDADPSVSHDFAFREPDHIPQHQFDIGPFMGITPTHSEPDVDIIPNIMTNENFYELLGQLNKKQEEFYTHIMHQAAQSSEQVLCALHGGAGTGKSSHSCNLPRTLSIVE